LSVKRKEEEKTKVEKRSFEIPLRREQKEKDKSEEAQSSERGAKGVGQETE